MVDLDDEVAEGVQEHLDHPLSHWDRFKLICLRKKAYKHVVSIFDEHNFFFITYIFLINQA